MYAAMQFGLNTSSDSNKAVFDLQMQTLVHNPHNTTVTTDRLVVVLNSLGLLGLSCLFLTYGQLTLKVSMQVSAPQPLAKSTEASIE